ncbi:MAG: hypothetical protein IRZ28_13390 [Steroidobacteraceae bacterium]|nr:hypothetical protein [Steroidobacteraceae bacterium]
MLTAISRDAPGICARIIRIRDVQPAETIAALEAHEFDVALSQKTA